MPSRNRSRRLCASTTDAAQRLTYCPTVCPTLRSTQKYRASYRTRTIHHGSATDTRDHKGEDGLDRTGGTVLAGRINKVKEISLDLGHLLDLQKCVPRRLPRPVAFDLRRRSDEGRQKQHVAPSLRRYLGLQLELRRADGRQRQTRAMALQPCSPLHLCNITAQKRQEA